MGQQTLQTIIAISGRVDNSFNLIGEQLTSLGSQINGISQKIIDFGKESVNIYRDYEDGILETRSTLSTLYSNSSDLDRAMDSLEDHAQKWAASTIFHTDDVADAMATAAHAGWNYDQIILGLPSSMLIAQAGSMELTQSVDYLAKMLASTNTDFQESERFIDQWARAADLVATDIPELGNAFIRLGSSAQFADSNAELFTMLAVLANVGTVGESAGTGVRNMMMRLIAPTQKAAKAMEGLGFSSDELEEAFEGVDAQSEAAYQRLAEYGFSAYDAQGNLKSFIDIFTDLNWALDQLPTEQEQNKILATIFPTRTLAYAKAMLNAVKDGSIYSIYEAIYGDSEGYAQEKSDILMSGLTGSMEILGSKWEELKRKTGETLAPDVESVADTLGGMIDKINDMDESTFDALVSGVGVIAAAGPGLLLAGSAFRLIGYLLTPAGGLGLGLVALTAAAAAVKELSEADMAGNFGDMKLDAQSLSEYVVGLGADFKTAYSEVNEFNAALEQSVTDYTNASQTFSSELLTAMLTGTTLTEDTKTKLQGLGQDMYKSLVEGINNSTAASMSYFEMLFGGEGTAEYDPQYQEIISLTNQSYLDALATAESLSQGLRDALTSAFDDGTVSADEYAEIQGWMQSYNDAMSKAAAEAQREQDYVTQQMLFHKAQTASYDEIKELASEVQTERDSLLASAEEEYLKERFKLEYRGASEETLSALDAQYERHVTEQSAKYDGILTRLWESSIEQSDLGTAYSDLEGLADRVLGGELSAESAVKLFKDAYGKNELAGDSLWWWDDRTRTQLGEYLARMIASYGGYEGLTAKADYYDSVGDTESANNLRRLYAMQQINDNFASTGVLNYNGVLATLFGDSTIFSSAADEYGIMQAQKSPFLEYMQDYISSYTAETARQTAAAFSGENGRMDDYLAEVGKGQNANDVNGAWSKMSKTARSEYQRMVESLRAVYDFDKVLADETNVFAQDGSAFQDDAAVYSLLYGNASRDLEKYKITTEIDPILDEGAMQDAVGDQTITVPVEPEATEYSAEIAKQTIAAVGGGMDAYLAEIGNGQDARDVNAAWSEMSREARTEYQNMVDALQEVYDFDRVLAGETNMFAEAGGAFRDDAAVYSLLYGNASHDLEKYKITAEIDPVLDEGAVQDAAGSQEIKVPVEPEVPEDTGELEMPSTVTGAAEAAQAAHSDAQSVMDDPLAQSVHVSDNGSAAATRGAIASTFSTPITQYINVVQRGGGGLINRLAKYADGGRADEPSIFGEAGPEWAIPEEHSERTAWLLDAARQASGFTWPELLTRNGGLNAGGGNTPSQLIYSPTIIANDANGVEQRLIEDKARLEKWYQDKQLHDDVEVYA